MAVSQDVIDYVCDSLRDFGHVESKKMFGGAGLYHKNIFFGLMADDILYFKVDETNRSDYTDAGSGPFKPYGNDSYSMSYYEVPADILEGRDSMAVWASKAYEVALKNRKPRKVQDCSKGKPKRKQ